MTIEFHEMVDIFKIGVGFYKRKDQLIKSEIDFIESQYLGRNTGNQIGKDYDFLNNSELKSINDFCAESVNHYYNETLMYKPKLEIVASWVNKTSPGEYHHRHHHTNSIISGVFYTESIKEAPINFYNTIEKSAQIQASITEYNNYNSPTWYLDIEHSNFCILFPSTLEHEVFKNISNKDRYSIAFNAFFEKDQEVWHKGTNFYKT